MKILGIIPARYQSSRFPGKPLIDIDGMSMIQRVYTQAKKSKLLSDVLVATDDERIYNHVENFGGKAVMTSSTHETGTSRCGEVISTHSDFDVVINIQGDEPLIRPEQIDEVLTLFNDESIKIGTVVKQIVNTEDLINPNRIKVVLDKNQNALYFSRSAIPFKQGVILEDWLDEGKFFKHIGIYAWRINTLKELLQLEPCKLEKTESLEQLRWLFHGYSIRTVETEIETPNIDTPEDVATVLKALGK